MDQGYNKTSDTRAYLVKDILGNTTTRKLRLVYKYIIFAYNFFCKVVVSRIPQRTYFSKYMRTMLCSTNIQRIRRSLQYTYNGIVGI